MTQKAKPQGVSPDHADHSVDTPPPTLPKKITNRPLIIAIVLVATLPLLVWGANRISKLRSKAAPPPIASVHINPEKILTDIKGKSVYLSTLAYDAGGSPIWSGIRYQWGMSTTDSIGKLYPNQDEKLATFEPSSTIRGRADIWVKAYDVNGQTAIGAIPVYVGVTPTPTPPPTPTIPPPPTPKPQATLQVVSPNGNEKIIGGQSFTIRWTSTNVNTADIDLVNPSGTLTSIAAGVSNTGSFEWTPSQPDISGTQFKISILGYRTGIRVAQDQSDTFFALLVSPTPTPTSVLLPPTPTPISKPLTPTPFPTRAPTPTTPPPPPPVTAVPPPPSTPIPTSIPQYPTIIREPPPPTATPIPIAIPTIKPPPPPQPTPRPPWWRRWFPWFRF